jgi:predicted nucleic acid-binding Zn ribbon protein
MPREASLFDLTGGDIVEAFFLLRAEGKNIPPAWIERAGASRKNREKELGKLLKSKELDAMHHIRDWHVSYQKECFYRGLRALMELERKGKTKY